MNGLISSLVGILFYILAFALGIATMINGWGLEIHSLGWVLAGNVGVIILAGIAGIAFQEVK